MTKTTSKKSEIPEEIENHKTTFNKKLKEWQNVSMWNDIFEIMFVLATVTISVSGALMLEYMNEYQIYTSSSDEELIYNSFNGSYMSFVGGGLAEFNSADDEVK